MSDWRYDPEDFTTPTTPPDLRTETKTALIHAIRNEYFETFPTSPLDENTRYFKLTRVEGEPDRTNKVEFTVRAYVRLTPCDRYTGTAEFTDDRTNPDAWTVTFNTEPRTIPNIKNRLSSIITALKP